MESTNLGAGAARLVVQSVGQDHVQLPVVVGWQPVDCAVSVRRLGVERRARLRMVNGVVLVTVRVHDRLVDGVRRRTGDARLVRAVRCRRPAVVCGRVAQ